jgi:hypothetical protein
MASAPHIFDLIQSFPKLIQRSGLQALPHDPQAIGDPGAHL